LEEAEGDSSPAPSRRGRGLAIGCGVLLALVVALPTGGFFWWQHRQDQAHERALERQAEKATAVFEPALEKLAPAPAAAPSVDIDKTIRVIHGLDLAMKQESGLDGWLQTLARQDYRGVAPEVLESRREILEILQPLYAKQTELEDQQAVWELTSEMLLATLSVVSVSGDVNLMSPTGEFSVDRQQARKLWEEVKERQSDRKKLQAEVRELDERLFDAMLDYADVYYDYVERWDRLSVLRDRAYLAARSGDWVAAEQSAQLAIAQAPSEREAHLLAAMAILEQGQPDRFPEAQALLEQTIQAHPDQTAPALLLMGVLDARRGDPKAARLHLQQAAAYYPKQADQLLDMLDPYKMRAFLEKSREGTFIVELYQSTMLGAGYFSPDLQLARLHFAEGDFEGGRAKVLDHFARRRAQQQWDFVISDITFCQELLGADFRRIFPEDAWLDLEVSRPMMGGGLSLAIDNRGDRTLRNGTLVLALHLTDMFPGQYTAVPAPATVPAVLAHEVTDFGTLEPELSVAGKPKTIDDIVEHRAILISDEAVVWVDTDAFKIAEADEFRKTRQQVKTGIRPAARDSEQAPLRGTYESVIGGLSQGVDLQIEQKYGKDNVLVKLPRELSILHPIFRLKYGEQFVLAEDNVLEGDQIVLRFPAVDNFDGQGVPQNDLELVLSSPFGDVLLTWKPSGELSWDYRGVKTE
jgi:tetratricopeptide (TPR) repeat protein